MKLSASEIKESILSFHRKWKSRERRAGNFANERVVGEIIDVIKIIPVGVSEKLAGQKARNGRMKRGRH